MAEIKSLRSLAKTSATSKDVLLVTNTSTNAAKQYSLSNLFPSCSTSGILQIKIKLILKG